MSEVPQYNGICYAHGHLIEPVIAQGGCPSVGCSGETCDSLVMDFDDPMVLADDYERTGADRDSWRRTCEKLEAENTRLRVEVSVLANRDILALAYLSAKEKSESTITRLRELLEGLYTVIRAGVDIDLPTEHLMLTTEYIAAGIAIKAGGE